jgi:exopolyphosphatase/guanosine-5'-triphosphate,3'-diphosphate pyrophosphatase
MKQKYYAAIDIGTNAGRMLIGYVVPKDGHDIVKHIQLVRVPLRLGEDVFSTGIISKEKLKKFVLSLKGFRFLAKAYGIDEIMAYATSAMREAKNKDYVLDRIKSKAKIDLETIEGNREAELIFKSFNISGLIQSKPFLLIDVGGGSTELTVFANGEKKKSKSFKIGTLRLLKNKVKPNIWNDISNWLDQNIKECGDMSAIGTGGNINKISQLARKRYLEPIQLNEIKETYGYLKSFSLQERIDQLRLKPDRADVILPASDIYIKIMEIANVRDIFVPKMGLSDGMILEQYYNDLAK